MGRSWRADSILLVLSTARAVVGCGEDSDGIPAGGTVSDAARDSGTAGDVALQESQAAAMPCACVDGGVERECFCPADAACDDSYDTALQKAVSLCGGADASVKTYDCGTEILVIEARYSLLTGIARNYYRDGRRIGLDSTSDFNPARIGCVPDSCTPTFECDLCAQPCSALKDAGAD